jgi:hypothetical protein
MHDRRVANVTVCEDHEIDPGLADDLLQLGLRPDRNSLWVQVTSELGWVTAVRDAGDLRRR